VVEKQLRAHLKQFAAAPVLFVGCGVSRRFLGLPDWTGLLRYLAGLTGNDYDYYSSTAAGDPGQIASLMAPALHDYLWQAAQKPLRTKYKDHVTAPDSAMKFGLPEHGVRRDNRRTTEARDATARTACHCRDSRPEGAGC
jgi:hypothetical protein